MSYKPAQNDRGLRRLCDGSARRLRRDNKRASARLMRRLARLDPENAPTRTIMRGYAS